MNIDYGGIDPISREGQEIRYAHLKNWRDWPPEELAAWRKATGERRPDRAFITTPREVFGFFLMGLVILYAMIAGSIMSRGLRREVWTDIKRIWSKIWERS